MKTLKEISDQLAKKQPQQIDDITEEAPILAKLQFAEASHPMWNMAEKVTDVQGAAFVEMNAPLPVVDSATNLVKVDLAIMGGEIEVPEDTAVMFGGKEKYFAKKMPKVLRRSGMSCEQRILYDNFRAFALDKGKAMTAGASAGGTYTILAVRFAEGENNGLYSPEGFKQGAMLDTQPINGGTLYKAASGTYQGVLVYGLRLKSYLGWQILNDQTVAAICNISATNVPTEAMVDDLLAVVRASKSNTKLLMHPRCKNLLNKYKGSALQVDPSNKDIDRTFTHWNGIEMLDSYNFLPGTEPVVSGLPTSI